WEAIAVRCALKKKVRRKKEWGARDARHRRVRAGLALVTRVGASERGQRTSFNYELRSSDESEVTIENRLSLDLDWYLSVRSQPARSVLTLERCARRRRFATVWSGWGSNSPRNSFRFCRAKLVIGWHFCSARSAPYSIVGAGALRSVICAWPLGMRFQPSAARRSCVNLISIFP